MTQRKFWKLDGGEILLRMTETADEVQFDRITVRGKKWAEAMELGMDVLTGNEPAQPISEAIAKTLEAEIMSAKP